MENKLSYLIKFRTNDGVGTYKLLADSMTMASKMFKNLMADRKIKQYQVLQIVGYKAF